MATNKVEEPKFPVQNGSSKVGSKRQLSGSKSGSGSDDQNGDKKAVLPGFLTKTFEIFSNREFDSVCGWNDKGDTIIIKKVEAFSSDVLPKYFKHSNFQSFVRQLNMYDFHKTVQDPSRREFQHKYFRRGKPELLAKIRRKVHGDKDAKSLEQSLSGKQLALKGAKVNSESICKELMSLRRRSEIMEDDIKRLQQRNTSIVRENELLWAAMQSSRERQYEMQSKMQKILFFLYKMYMHANENRRSAARMEGDAAPDAVSIRDPATQNFVDMLRFVESDASPGSFTSSAINENASPGELRFDADRQITEISPPQSPAFSNFDTLTPTNASVPSRIEMPSATLGMPVSDGNSHPLASQASYSSAVQNSGVNAMASDCRVTSPQQMARSSGRPKRPLGSGRASELNEKKIRSSHSNGRVGGPEEASGRRSDFPLTNGQARSLSASRSNENPTKGLGDTLPSLYSESRVRNQSTGTDGAETPEDSIVDIIGGDLIPPGFDSNSQPLATLGSSEVDLGPIDWPSKLQHEVDEFGKLGVAQQNCLTKINSLEGHLTDIYDVADLDDILRNLPEES